MSLRFSELVKNRELIGCYGLSIDIDLNYEVKNNQNYEYFFNNLLLPDNSYKSLLSGEMMLPISCLLVKKDVLADIQFNTKLNFTYDWEFLLKLFQKYEDKICQIKEPVCISRNEDVLYGKSKKSFFIKYLNELLKILDKFFSDENSDIQQIKCDTYKKFYYYFLYILSEYFPHSYLLKIYLLSSYLEKNSSLGNNLFDFGFISLLLYQFHFSFRFFKFSNFRSKLTIPKT